MNVGLHYLQGWGVDVDQKESFAYYSEAALAFDAQAQYAVASAHYKVTRGMNLLPPTPCPPSFLLLLLLQCSAQPTCNIVQGEGVPEDHKLAVEWFKLAAAQGHESSMNALYVLGKWARTAERFKQKGAAAALDRLAA